jgi:hypothetical protein
MYTGITLIIASTSWMKWTKKFLLINHTTNLLESRLEYLVSRKIIYIYTNTKLIQLSFLDFNTYIGKKKKNDHCCSGTKEWI